MTTPYVTGTVSVTAGNAVVTGVGTAWKTGLVIGGMFGLDSANGNPVPIASVDSDTQLTLAKPWRGTSAAGQAYWIMRDTTQAQQSVANASALAQIISELRSAALAAIAGLTPGADKLPFFSSGGSAALADLSPFARTLLDDANAAAVYQTLGEVPDASLPGRLSVTGTSVNPDAVNQTGFYTIDTTQASSPIPGQRFMMIHLRYSSTIMIQLAYMYSTSGRVFYRTSASGTSWAPWRLIGADIVGTVSNAAGFPAGAIIERGSNANGEYVRFADGTQKCFKTLPSGNPTIAPNAYVTISGGSWPAQFSAIPYPSIGYEGSWSPHALLTFSAARVGSIDNIFLKNTDTAASRAFNGNVYLMADGRWF